MRYFNEDFIDGAVADQRLAGSPEDALIAFEEAEEAEAQPAEPVVPLSAIERLRARGYNV